MNYIFKAAIVSLTLGLGACASVHHRGMDAHATAGHDGQGAEHGMQCPMMGMMTPLVGCHGVEGDVDARLASIRAALAVTPAQESAWSAYAEAYRAHAAHMAGMMDGMHRRSGDAAQPPIPERFQRHDAMMAQHMGAMRPLRVAIEALYATLSDAQKASADALRCD